MKRVLMLVNPKAGGRSGERGLDDLTGGLAEAGWTVQKRVTSGPGDAVRIVSDVGRDIDGVVVVGGDGTVHEVLQTLDLERHRLGVLPRGTGNDFAWAMGFTETPSELVSRWVLGRERRVDLGSWRARTPQGTRQGRLINSIGLGFEAVVNAESHRHRRLPSSLVYGFALLRALPRYRNYPVTVAMDGGAPNIVEAALLAIANGPRVGGRFLLAPNASFCDGELDVVSAASLSLARALLLLPRTLSGSHTGSPRVRFDRMRTLRLLAPEGIPMHVDGEFVHHRVSELEVDVLPGALSVV